MHEENIRGKGIFWWGKIAFVIIVFSFVSFFVGAVFTESGSNEGKTTIITESLLTKTIDISELSSAKYTYNGIAQVYEDENKKNKKCDVRYHAVVKAMINMKDVKFRPDHQNKTIFASLPEITLKSYLTDEESLSFIPANTKIELREAIAACEQDALEESQSSDELMCRAEQNMKSTIEALLLPLLKDEGYQIKWD